MCQPAIVFLQDEIKNVKELQATSRGVVATKVIFRFPALTLLFIAFAALTVRRVCFLTCDESMDRQVLDWTTVAILVLAVLAVLALSVQSYRTLKLAVARAELAEAYLAACLEQRSPRERVRIRRDALCSVAEEPEVGWGLLQCWEADDLKV